jgi:hypothetical protein
VRVRGRVHLGEAFSKKPLKKGPSPAIYLRKDIGIESFKKPGTEFGVGLASPKPSHLVLLENIIPGKDLVCSLAGEYDFKMVFPNKTREFKERGRGRAKDRSLGVPDNQRKDFPDILFAAVR